MKIQKYLASSMPEAMKKVRSELGNEAVILHSKVVYTGGFLGLFKKRNIEVLAAIDPSLSNQPSAIAKNKKEAVISPILLKTSNPIPDVDVKWDVPNKSIEKKPPTPEYPKIMQELDKLNQSVQSITDSNKELVLEIPNPIKKVLQNLSNQGIDHSIHTALLHVLVEKWYATGSNASHKEIVNWTRDKLMEMISPFSFGELKLQKKYINVIGPTGVGKTTTLAKIAGNIILKEQKKVGFITTDTYRIGAIEQLKTYANILSVPVEVCYSLEDFHAASKKLNTCDVVLIDTAGRNFRNKKYVDDLMEVVDYKREMETLLVLSMTAKQQDLEEIYNQFSAIQINHFVFTKLDETSSYGAMLNLIVKYKIGAAYITTGQNVPDDIIPANPTELVNRILEVE